MYIFVDVFFQVPAASDTLCQGMNMANHRPRKPRRVLLSTEDFLQLLQDAVSHRMDKLLETGTVMFPCDDRVSFHHVARPTEGNWTYAPWWEWRVGFKKIVAFDLQMIELASDYHLEQPVRRWQMVKGKKFPRGTSREDQERFWTTWLDGMASCLEALKQQHLQELRAQPPLPLPEGYPAQETWAAWGAVPMLVWVCPHFDQDQGHGKGKRTWSGEARDASQSSSPAPPHVPAQWTGSFGSAYVAAPHYGWHWATAPQWAWRQF